MTIKKNDTEVPAKSSLPLAISEYETDPSSPSYQLEDSDYEYESSAYSPSSDFEWDAYTPPTSPTTESDSEPPSPTSSVTESDMDIAELLSPPSSIYSSDMEMEEIINKLIDDLSDIEDE
jgi:hypothetical protein